ncbi:hypothetical protein M5689_011746 [Euphorbia peplus]|nr:hypothetical protein M5689_011746 [Euphorbia peplus]
MRKIAAMFMLVLLVAYVCKPVLGDDDDHDHDDDKNKGDPEFSDQVQKVANDVQNKAGETFKDAKAQTESWGQWLGEKMKS